MSHPFASTGLDIDDRLAACFGKDGIEAPTPVQQRAIPLVLAGKDVIIQSGTGTGKTLAYVLPLLQRAGREPDFRAVIIAPSPELAMQILRTVEAYKAQGVRSTSLVGSGNIERQKEKLKAHPQIIAGTPGRVLEMIFARKVKTKSIKALVLDEVDQILSDQNDAELKEVCSRPEFEAQIILASATIAKRAEAFAREAMHEERLRPSVDRSPLPQNIEHRFMVFAAERSESALVRLIRGLDIDRALVFVHKGYTVPKLFHALVNHQIPCATLSAEADKRQRQQAIEALRSGAARVLVATDAAARGLDIKDLRWVIHFELANDKQAYLHRAGRTGRAGKRGTSIVMVTKDELPALERQARELRLELAEVGLDAADR
ncbi:MAG: DEAD/DEAH box helicase [Deltaproteobacteria bacterium]|nr:DEAD/DEAH box helicase [Deltaproteobacteria bacterium]